MLSRNTIYTIGSKLIILLTSFLMVIFSTHIWGSTGRGEIALIISSVSIIAIFGNVFCGSSVAYHAPVLPRNLLLFTSLAGAFIMSLSGSIVFSLISGFRYFLPLFLISLLLSLTTGISSYWLGKNNFKYYNLISVLSPGFVLISLVVLFFIFNRTSLDTYFVAYYAGTGAVLLFGLILLLSGERFRLPDFNREGIKSIFKYGANNEFNYLIQFLNYRLAYYFIAKVLGLGQLGIFSIVVSVSEAVWIISRSMSAIHFSNVINSDDHIKNRIETRIFARQSFLISVLILGISVLIPQTVYKFVFGPGFGDVKRFILLLIPGIISIAVSNLYGHYFAGRGKLKVLRNKSLIGLAATLLLLPFLLKNYQLIGACITLNVSYILSSAYLWFEFNKEGRLSDSKTGK